MSNPIKSRHGLTRCRACRAHIQAGERPSATDCPFCGANLRSGTPRISLPTGRGGLLAASLLAFGALGCGGSDGGAESETITAEPAQTGDEGPGGGTAQNDPANQNDPADDPGYAPAEDPVAVEAYGAPPPEDEPAPAPEPAPESDTQDDSFQQRPSDEYRPAPRYGLPVQLRDRARSDG